MNANTLALSLADQIEEGVAAATQDPAAAKAAKSAANKAAWQARAASQKMNGAAGPPTLIDAPFDGGVLPPGPDEQPPGAEFSPPPVVAPAPSMPNVLATDATSKAKNRPAATRASQVAPATEMLRISKVDDRGKQSFISDYTVGEIDAAGPDLTAFISRVLSPKYGAGDYVVYKHGSGGTMQFLQQVNVAGEVRPAPTPAASYAQQQMQGAPGPSLKDLDDMAARRAEEARRVAAEAEAKARADVAAREEAARKIREEEQAKTAQVIEELEKRKRAGESGPMDMLLMMKLLQPQDTSPKEDPRFQQLADGINQLANEMRMIPSMMQPPPPLPPAGPSVVEIATGVATALAGVVSPFIAIWQQSKAQEVAAQQEAARLAAASAMTPEKAMALATGAVTLATSLGLIGKKEASPLEQALAERIKAEMNAEPADPFEQMQRLLDMIDKLKPKSDTAKGVLEVIDHAIDRMPDVFDSFGRLAEKRMGAVPMLTDKNGKKSVPKPFADLRAEVAKIVRTVPAGRDRDIAILRVTIPGLGATFQAGGAWKSEIEALLESAKKEDVEAVKRIFAGLVRRAWAKDDKGATDFFRAVFGCFQRYPREIGVLLRGEKPEDEEAQTEGADDGEGEADASDLVDDASEGDGEVTGEPHLTVVPPPDEEGAGAP